MKTRINRFLMFGGRAGEPLRFNGSLSRRVLGVAGLGALLAAGCGTGPAAAPKAPTVVLAVRATGGGTPSGPQFANMYRALAAHVTRAGFRLAETSAPADFVVTADFTPDPVNPDGGHVRIVAVEPGRRFVSGDEESAESREMRQRLREIERWIDNQSRPGLMSGP